MFNRTSRVPLSILRSPLAEAVPRKELEMVDRRGTEVRLNAGRRIMQEAAAGRECLLVIDGTLDVHRDGVHVATLGPGDFVGEMSLLNHAPRSATVTARTDTAAYAFSRRDFATLLSECPELAAHVRGLAEKRSLAGAA